MKKTCHDCGVEEGQIHKWNCDMEECPNCGGQMISCDCLLTEKSAEILGRFPYIVYPNLCARCGTLWPEMFHVQDADWERYVQRSKRDKMLCRSCYDAIKELIDSAVKLDVGKVKA
jgi:hypothetical protein